MEKHFLPGLRRYLPFLTVAAFALFIFTGDAYSQYRDYMTEDEIEIVREAQILDERIAVLVKMIDRRFEALGKRSGGQTEKKLNNLKWGDTPTGTRMELIYDIQRLLNKAVDDIDNTMEGGHSPLAPEKDKEKIFPKAIKAIDAACKRYLPLLNELLDATEDERERGLILQSIETCEEVIEAAKKI